MPRLSRPTLKPKASSAWVTALSEERDCALAGTALPIPTAAMLSFASPPHDRMPTNLSFEFRGRITLDQGEVCKHSANRTSRSTAETKRPFVDGSLERVVHADRHAGRNP